MAVDEHIHVKVSIELLRGGEVVRKSEDDHGGLLGGIPPVPAVTVQDKPLRSLLQQGIFGVSVGEEAHGKGRALRIVVVVKIKQRIVIGWPVCERSRALCLIFKQLCDLRGAAVRSVEHGESGERETLGGEVIAARPERVQK